MQTPAEKYLVDTLKSFLGKYHKEHNNIPRIMNIGAGRSVVIEKQLIASEIKFVCDRVEVEHFDVSGYCVENCYKCSVEDMPQVKSAEYNVVFANYVLEHIQYLNGCASEINRILKPGGIFIASIPNPTAPEFLLSRLTPLWFHGLIRRGEAWETHYAFKDIYQLGTIFQKNGLNVHEVYYRSYLEAYMEKFIVLNKLSRLYDKILNASQIKRLMGSACVVFKKPA